MICSFEQRSEETIDQRWGLLSPNHTYHILHPARIAEHIHGLALLKHIPALRQQLQIPGLGGHMAADVHHAAGACLGDGVNHSGLHTLAGRVQHHHVHLRALPRQLGGGLRRVGADTTEVKRFLQVDFESTVARCRILQGARLYRDGIAVAVLETEQDRVVVAQAADELVNIARVKASIVMYSTASGGVIMSARSISDINVQMILEKLGGGGNKSSAGVQLANISLRDAVNQLFRAIDEYLDA